MTTYVMQAKENYSASFAESIDGASFLWNSARGDQFNLGQFYDHVRRKIIYSVSVVDDPVNPHTNDTGFTLWAGDASITIDPLDTYDARLAKNKWIATKDLDTEVVTFYNCWSEDNLVPAVIAGDGTWRRFVSSTAGPSAGSGNFPTVSDPRTGNVWQHVLGQGQYNCTVYLFRLEDAYSQIISPFQVDDTATSSHYEPVGTTEDWTYINCELITYMPGDGRYIALTPREITADETTEDRLLNYAVFPLLAPFFAFASDVNYRLCFNHGSELFLFGTNAVGARDYVLHKFEEPTSAPYGGPVVGGGFTDITPWAAATGPNTDITDYDLNSGTKTLNKLMLYYLPVTDDLVCITKLVPADTGVGVTDPLLFRMDCTYVDPVAETFDYHQAFVTGYMTEDWEPTAVAADAAWAVQDVQEINLYLNQASYMFAGIDYTKRWFFFRVQPVVGGVWTPDAADNHKILVEYTFVSGAAPVASQVIDEQGWDDTYTAYATAIANTNVVDATIDLESGDLIYNNGIYDPATNAFWWGVSANANIFDLDAAFTGRAVYYPAQVTPPLLRLLTFEAGTTVRARNGVSYYRVPS